MMIFRILIICGLLSSSAAWADTMPAPLPLEKPFVIIESAADAKRDVVKVSQKQGFSTRFVGEMETYETVYEDTLIDLARKNGLGFVELQAANPTVDAWMPGADVEILLPKMNLLPDAEHKGIVINLPEMRLYHFASKNSKPRSYPIGIGREGLLTPTGKTHVRAMKKGPTWRPTARMRKEDPTLPASVPPGPENPLGTHMLYLGWPTYGIHGTDKPYGIGRRVSSGCIRMYPEDIIKLYGMVKKKAPVQVVNQPIKAAWIENKFYIEAHPTMKQADQMEDNAGHLTYEISDDDMALIIKTAGSYATEINWRRVREIIRKRNGYPVVVAEKPQEDS